MKATSILIFGALVCSAAARPAGKGGFKGNQNKGGFKGFGGKGKGASGSAAVSATAVSSAAAAASSAPANNNAAAGGGSATDLQTSLTLDSSVICSNFTDDGQNPPVAGQSPSLTSTNNFINFCLLTLPETPLTNGAQIITGSCNPTPIGLIPAVDSMPSAKFLFPTNGAVIAANQAFNAQLNIANMQTGVFTNAAKTYFAAPQQLNAQGKIIGHTHIVIEALADGLGQITPNDPNSFFFFKGVDDPDVNGVATAAVTAGVPAGAYRMCSINTSSNHQPAIVPVAQHGSLDDCSYFTAK